MPERWLQRLHILDFATIQGMVVHVQYSYGETNMLFSTQYRLELRDAHGRERQWSCTRRYRQTKHDTHAAVSEQVVKHFERGQASNTKGLPHSGSSYYYDRDNVRNTWYTY